MDGHSATLIGLSWIPNLSGRIASDESLTRCFAGTVVDDDYRFDYDSNTKSVTASCKDDRDTRIRVDFVDDYGLCYIYLLNQKRPFHIDNDDEIETSYTIMESWKRIMNIVGNSSSIQSYEDETPHGAVKNCACNAMDWPIPFNESLTENSFEMILDKFIKSSEDVADVTRYVLTKASYDIFGKETSESIRDRMNAENIGISIQAINSIYMDSFISLYANKIKNVSRYRNENRMISRKLVAVSNFNSNSAQIDNLCLRSNSINIAKWGVIIASIAFGLNVISLLLTNI